MLPTGGHKGYGIAVMVEALTGLIAGGATLSGLQSWASKPDEPAGLSQTFIAINVGNIVDIQQFKQNAAEMYDELRAIPMAKDAKEAVRVPGDGTQKRRRYALEHGYPYPKRFILSFAWLQKLCAYRLHAS